jgi:hypothetical protein
VTEGPAHCSTCGVELIGAVRAAPGVEADGWLALYENWRAAARARDWKAIGDLCSADFHWSSYQAGLGFELTGGDEYAASTASVYERESDFLCEVLATRGQWCLIRFHAFGPGDEDVGPWEIGRLGVNGMDVDGKWARVEVYDETEIERARARLDELATDTAE